MIFNQETLLKKKSVTWQFVNRNANNKQGILLKRIPSFEMADQERWSLDVQWKLFSVRDFRRIRVDSASIDK